MNQELGVNSMGTVRDQYVSNISMIVTLISFTMLFATLFLGYAMYRLTSEQWPPMGMEALSLGLPSLSTFVIAFSSYTYWKFEKNGKTFWLKATGFFGLLFMVSQLMLWSSLQASGLYAGSGIFGSIVYGFTWIHAAHILMGLGALVWLNFKLKRNNATQLTVQNVGKFWHFLGIVWLVMFVFIFAI